VRQEKGKSVWADWGWALLTLRFFFIIIYLFIVIFIICLSKGEQVIQDLKIDSIRLGEDLPVAELCTGLHRVLFDFFYVILILEHLIVFLLFLLLATGLSLSELVPGGELPLEHGLWRLLTYQQPITHGPYDSEVLSIEDSWLSPTGKSDLKVETEEFTSELSIVLVQTLSHT
jgi:hypothetical protein